MPRIDWSDEDQPRWQPRYRPRRERSPRPGGDRPSTIRPGLDSVPLILAGLARELRERQPARRPLHLIWGAPQPTDRPPASE
ncbi:MAG: hypothetical protein M3336_06860 [Chloroflexota bacterium]|nr:hypothetical protein [Chloroflexota bacterium]